ASWKNVFREGVQGLNFLLRIIYQLSHPQDHYRAVIHRVIEHGARQYEPVEQRHRNADRDTVLQLAQHSASGGAVDVEEIIFASIGGRNYVRLIIGYKDDVSQET